MTMLEEKKVRVTDGQDGELGSFIQETFIDAIFPDATEPLLREKGYAGEILTLNQRLERLRNHKGATCLVVGAGNAGLESTRKLLEQGAFVVVVEADNLPGGLGNAAGEHNQGGLSFIEKAKKRREVTLKAMRILEHPNVLFLPNTHINIQSASYLDSLNSDGIVLATGGREKKEFSFDHHHPSMFTSSEWIASNHEQLVQTGQAVDADAMVDGKRIARNPDGSLAPVVIIGGGNVALQDDAKHAQAIRLVDENVRIHGEGDARKVDVEKAIHGEGILKMAEKLDIPQETLVGKTIVAYRGPKGLMRPMVPPGKLIDKYQTENGADRRAAAEMARGDQVFQETVRRNIDVITGKQGIVVWDHTVVESVTPMTDGTGRLQVVLLRGPKDSQVPETVEAGALVTAIGFDPVPTPKFIRTPTVGVGTLDDGRGNLEESEDSAHKGMQTLTEAMLSDGRIHTRKINIEALERLVAQAKNNGFDGNVIRLFLQDDSYWTRKMFLRRDLYVGQGSKPSEIREPQKIIVANEDGPLAVNKELHRTKKFLVIGDHAQSSNLAQILGTESPTDLITAADLSKAISGRSLGEFAQEHGYAGVIAFANENKRAIIAGDTRVDIGDPNTLISRVATLVDHGIRLGAIDIGAREDSEGNIIVLGSSPESIRAAALLQAWQVDRMLIERGLSVNSSKLLSDVSSALAEINENLDTLGVRPVVLALEEQSSQIESRQDVQILKDRFLVDVKPQTMVAYGAVNGDGRVSQVALATIFYNAHGDRIGTNWDQKQEQNKSAKFPVNVAEGDTVRRPVDHLRHLAPDTLVENDAVVYASVTAGNDLQSLAQLIRHHPRIAQNKRSFTDIVVDDYASEEFVVRDDVTYQRVQDNRTAIEAFKQQRLRHLNSLAIRSVRTVLSTYEGQLRTLVERGASEDVATQLHELTAASLPITTQYFRQEGKIAGVELLIDGQTVGIRVTHTGEIYMQSDETQDRNMLHNAPWPNDVNDYILLRLLDGIGTTAVKHGYFKTSPMFQSLQGARREDLRRPFIGTRGQLYQRSGGWSRFMQADHEDIFIRPTGEQYTRVDKLRQGSSLQWGLDSKDVVSVILPEITRANKNIASISQLREEAHQMRDAYVKTMILSQLRDTLEISAREGGYSDPRTVGLPEPEMLNILLNLKEEDVLLKTYFNGEIHREGSDKEFRTVRYISVRLEDKRMGINKMIELPLRTLDTGDFQFRNNEGQWQTIRTVQEMRVILGQQCNTTIEQYKRDGHVFMQAYKHKLHMQQALLGKQYIDGQLEKMRVLHGLTQRQFELLYGNLTVSSEGNLFLHRVNRKTGEEEFEWLLSDRAVRKRMERIIATNKSMATKREEIEENIQDAALYAASAVAGVAVSAGFNHLVGMPKVTATLAGLLWPIVRFAHQHFLSQEDEAKQETKAYSDVRLKRKITGAALWFLTAVGGESFADGFLPDNKASGDQNHGVSAGHHDGFAVELPEQTAHPDSPSQPNVDPGLEIADEPPVDQLPAADVSSYAYDWVEPMQEAIRELGGTHGWVNTIDANGVTQAEVMVDFAKKFGSQLTSEQLKNMIDRITQTKDVFSYMDLRLELAQELQSLGVQH